MNIKDLKPISVPESHEYFLKLIWQRHLLNFFFEIKQLGLQDKEYLKVLERILSNPQESLEDWQNESFDEATKKQLDHILKLVREQNEKPK